ncbi:ATP-binding protein [Thalassotalea montiporae]
MKSYSIRRYLTLNITAWVLTMTIIPAAWVYYDTSREVEELFDASLAQSARVLHGMLSRQTVEQHQVPMVEALLAKEKDPHVMQHNYEKKVSFQVIDETGLILRSASAPDHPESGLKQGYTFHLVGEFEWRIFTLFSKEDNWWLVVGERMDIRDELVHDIALDHAIPLFAFTPFFIFIVNLVIRNGLKPLAIIAKDVKDRDYNSLEKLAYNKEPEEVSSLIDEINLLFDSLSGQYEKERRFSSDAAHELRTPLAALMIHTENLLEENDNAALDGAIINLKRGIHRLSHLVTQLLALSRADAEVAHHQFDAVNLLAIVDKVLADNRQLAQNKEQTLTIKYVNNTENSLEFQGNAPLLHNMLSNVVSNAIKYSPMSSDITILVDLDGQKVTVQDQGPGVPAELLERVKDRFFRVPTAKAEGSGLGLAIVDKIASLHEIHWQLQQRPEGGLAVEFSFAVHG